MKIALCQIQSTKDISANLRLLREYTEAAVSKGARLVVFPEASMVSFGGSLYDDAAQHELSFRQTLGNLAREHRVTVVAGGFAPVQLSDEWNLRVHNNLYAFVILFYYKLFIVFTKYIFFLSYIYNPFVERT